MRKILAIKCPGRIALLAVVLATLELPYSLKFLRLKIFADFTGWSAGAKNFSRNFKFITDVRHGSTTKILSVKICF